MLSNNEITALAQKATSCLLMQVPMSITHQPGWVRNGLPLPMKRQKPSDDGTTTQDYRPLGILEYVHEVLSGELTKRQNRDKKIEKEEADKQSTVTTNDKST